MKRRSTYWVGERPTGGERWAYATHGTVIDDPHAMEVIFQMHGRYVKRWNDIELDRSRSLSEHTHEVRGAKVVGGGSRRFILHAQENNKEHWILEILYSRGFSEFCPGGSFGKNSLRSTDDIRSIHLHWSDDAQMKFEKWLAEEKLANQANGE
jgi:hypothetical protein